MPSGGRDKLHLPLWSVVLGQGTGVPHRWRALECKDHVWMVLGVGHSVIEARAHVLAAFQPHRTLMKEAERPS